MAELADYVERLVSDTETDIKLIFPARPGYPFPISLQGGAVYWLGVRDFKDPAAFLEKLQQQGDEATQRLSGTLEPDSQTWLANYQPTQPPDPLEFRKIIGAINKLLFEDETFHLAQPFSGIPQPLKLTWPDGSSRDFSTLAADRNGTSTSDIKQFASRKEMTLELNRLMLSLGFQAEVYPPQREADTLSPLDPITQKLPFFLMPTRPGQQLPDRHFVREDADWSHLAAVGDHATANAERAMLESEEAVLSQNQTPTPDERLRYAWISTLLSAHPTKAGLIGGSPKDTGTWGSDYTHAMVLRRRLGVPNTPTVDEIAERVLYFFPSDPGIDNDTPFPVRWRAPGDRTPYYFSQRRVGPDYPAFGDGEKKFNGIKIADGAFRMPGGDYVETGHSRESVATMVLSLARVYQAGPSPGVAQRIRDAIDTALGNMQSHSYERYRDPVGLSAFYSLTQSGRHRLRKIEWLPREFEALIPKADQIDALKGADKLFVYAMLRAGAIVNPSRWEDQADRYFRDWNPHKLLTSVKVYFRLYTALRNKGSKHLKFVLGLGGHLPELIGEVLTALLGTAGLTLLGLKDALQDTTGTVHALQRGKIEIDRMAAMWNPVQLEQRLAMFLLENDSSPEARGAWQDVLQMVFLLNIRKSDALSCAYYVASPLGREYLNKDLAEIQRQLDAVEQALRRAKRSWCRLLTSRRRRKRYRRLLRQQQALRLQRRLVFLVKANAHVLTPKRILLGNYGHHYNRRPAQHDHGTIANKLTHLNKWWEPDGLVFGTNELGHEILRDIQDTPGMIDTVMALTDKGIREQFKRLPEAYLWINRASITKHNPWSVASEQSSDGTDNRLTGQGGNIFLVPAEATLAYYLLRDSGVEI
jgi:DNA-binding PadR family transcriptional regulator